MKLTLPAALAPARDCIAATLQGRRVAAPDTGGATVDLALAFDPGASR